MPNTKKSLNQIFPHRYDIPSFLVLSFLFLLFGLFLPVITLKELILWKTTFSVLTGIENLFHEKHYILGSIILFFSIFFPITKLAVLFFVWSYRLSEKTRNMVIEWLGILGKWSMLDVFVVAMMIVITKISKFAHAEARIGIYFFGASIMLTMILTEKINHLLKKKHKSDKTHTTPIPTSGE